MPTPHDPAPPPAPPASPEEVPRPAPGVDPELRRRRLGWLGRGAAAPASPAAGPSDDPRAARRGRAPQHLVDLAVAWAARVEAGERQVDILRALPASRRPSRGYVSIVVRLGRVLRRLPPLELASLRSPRITYKLAQRLVRSGVPDETLLRQLGDALANPPTDGRRTRHRRRGARATPFPGGPLARGRARPDGSTGADEAVEAAAELLETMLASQRSLAAHLASRPPSRGPTAPPVLLAGQSLAALGRSIREYRQSSAAAARGGDGEAAAADARVRSTLRSVEASLTAALAALRRRPASGTDADAGEG